MEMELSTAVVAFLANTVVFVLLAGGLTGVMAGVRFADSYRFIGLRADEHWRGQLRLGVAVGLAIPLLQLVVIAAVAWLLSLAGLEVTAVLRDYYGAIAESPIGRSGVGGKVLVATLMLFAVSLGEELFFRGMLQTLLEQRFGGPAGLLITAVVFTLMHGFYLLPGGAAVASAVALFTVAIVLGLLKQRTGTLLASVAAHGVGNAIVYTIGANLVHSWV
jgi:membrane protease YdiL (CAAX protease family)